MFGSWQARGRGPGMCEGARLAGARSSYRHSNLDSGPVGAGNRKQAPEGGEEHPETKLAQEALCGVSGA